MKMRKLFGAILALVGVFSLTGCHSESIEGPQGPKGQQGDKGDPGVSIVSIDLTSSDGLVDIYTITYSDGSTSNFVVTNGANGEQGIQGIPGEDGHTPVISISNNGYWVIDDVETSTKAQGEQGEPGKDGTTLLTGNGLPNDDLGKNGDSYINLDTWDFYVKANGTWIHTGNIKGEQGNQGNDGLDGTAVLTGEGEPLVENGKNGDSYIDLITWNYYVKENDEWVLKGNIKGIDGSNGEDGINGVDGTAVLTGEGEPLVENGKNGDSYIDLDTWNYYAKENDKWVLKGNIKGTDGSDGENGQDGNGIVSIELTSSDDNIDTYTITYDNGETATFTITNGVDGEQGIQGEPGEDGHTPVITIGENGNWYIDGEDTGVLAEGVQGPQGESGEDGVDGEDGLSAYEIYIKYHPEYTGTEEEWLEDLVNGDLREEYKITFQTNGGSTIEPQYVKYGRLVTRPADDPTRTGYLFDGWYLGSELFPFNSYQVYDDLTLLAHWKSMNINLTLDANGGDVEYNTKTVTYGVDYVLPTPTRANYTFDGWYLDDTFLCPMSGVWTFSKVDITLKARWAGTEADITFASDDNVEVDNTLITLTYGEDYTLPVPTILTGDKFIGWADASGELVTDETGKSLKSSEFKTNTELHAVYYVPVTTPNQLLNLCTAEANDERLTRTYVLQNDLDFTGLANESIYNFTGIFDGNGYDIIGLEKPLFGSVGRSDVTCTDDIEVKNVDLVNFSGESFVNQVLGCETFTIDSVTIESFVKDDSNYCETYGIVKKVGHFDNSISSRNRPSSFVMTNCHIQDEFTTIETGFVFYLEAFKNVDISYCSIRSNTKQSAFVSGDIYSSDSFPKLYDGYYIDHENLSLYSTDVNISYCSNFGDSSSLANLSVGCHTDYYSSSYDYVYGGKHNVKVENCVNYGSVSELLVNSIYANESTASGGVVLTFQSGTFLVDCVLNFGEITSFLDSIYSNDKSENNFKSSRTFKVSSCFNGGLTASSSFGTEADSVSNTYQFIPIASIEDSGAFSISNYSQVNSDFFINTLGLDPKRWNLSYINIQDEYGLPSIIY